MLAAELQREGTRSFDKSCNDLMDRIASKTARRKAVSLAVLDQSVEAQNE